MILGISATEREGGRERGWKLGSVGLEAGLFSGGLQWSPREGCMIFELIIFPGTGAVAEDGEGRSEGGAECKSGKRSTR
jgi:hypothetical protein